MYYHKHTRKWCARLCLKDGKVKFGGYFNDELDAGKTVNQLCNQFGISAQNPEISDIPNKQYQVTETFVLSHSIVRKLELSN